MNKSYQILQLCLSGAWGGLEMVAFETALNGEKNGLHVLTVTLPDSPLFQNLEKAGLPVVGLVKSHRYLAFGAVRRLRKLIRDNDIQTVLVQQLRDLWQAVPALIGINRVRLVGMSHTFVGIDKKDLLHRWLYGRVDSVIALNSLHKENLKTHLPLKNEQFSVIPNSVNTDRFRPGIGDVQIHARFKKRPSTVLIGVVSRLDLQKGLREAIAAAKILSLKNIDFQMVIVGEETALEAGAKRILLEDIQAAQLEDFVSLIGFRSDIEHAMAAFDILLMPSPSETFGRVIIEAMACGVPVVATRAGGVPDIITDSENGLLVTPKDSQSMAEAMIRLCNDSKFREKISQAGVNTAHSKYSLPMITKNLFDNLVPARHR